jgi:hypothetical protein
VGDKRTANARKRAAAEPTEAEDATAQLQVEARLNPGAAKPTFWENLSIFHLKNLGSD